MGRQELQVWPQNAISTKKEGVHFHIIIIFKMGFFFLQNKKQTNKQTIKLIKSGVNFLYFMSHVQSFYSGLQVLYRFPTSMEKS